jgi:glycosyltransferase involved in cell wall biosynthesis
MHDDTSHDGGSVRRLTIVIPALNEQDAIGSTVQRCLDARDHIRESGAVDDVELIVVSDGSTDRTAEIARGFEDVRVYEFARNRGYGAAIKHGFERGTGDLVGFLDADGTCDPRFFAELGRAVADSGADIALGSRMSKDSRMPFVRSVGNRLYAVLLSLLANRHVTDTASGMRVIRRTTLPDLGPLPDGLHYTPAMSARAVLKGLKVVEIPMSYEERIGESKLRVSRDGWRFLQAIVDGVLLFRPERLFALIALALLAGAVLLSLNPVEFYISNRRIEDWMIYRFVVAFLFGVAGVLALTATALVSRMSELAIDREARTFWGSQLVRTFRGPRVVVGATLLFALSMALVWPGLREYATTGHVTLHWSRVLVAAFGLVVAFQAVLTAILLRIISLWLESAAADQERIGYD